MEEEVTLTSIGTDDRKCKCSLYINANLYSKKYELLKISEIIPQYSLQSQSLKTRIHMQSLNQFILK